MFWYLWEQYQEIWFKTLMFEIGSLWNKNVRICGHHWVSAYGWRRQKYKIIITSQRRQLLHRISYKTELKHLHALVCHLLIEDKHTDILHTVAALIFKEWCEMLRDNSDRITKQSTKEENCQHAYCQENQSWFSDPFGKFLLNHKIYVNYMIPY